MENPSYQYYLSYWVLQAAAMLLTVFLIPKLRVTSIFGALFMVIGIALVNAFYWDAALFFAVPDSMTIKTLLLFLSNGIIFWVLVKLLPGIESDGLLPALFAPLLFTFCSFLIRTYAGDVDWPKVFEELSALLGSSFQTLRAYFQE